MGNYMNQDVLIPKFTIADVSGVTFGGFKVDKYICSQPNATPSEAATDVAHSGAARAVPGISRPGLPVWDYITFPQAMIACCNKGKGWHLISALEWASLAFLSKKYGTMPHGGNANVDPPADVTYTEIAMLDKHVHGEGGTYHRALPGTGPNTWAHNHVASGVFDLQGLAWQWNLMLMSTDGFPYVPANLDVTYTGSPYGRGTISGSGGATPTLTCDGAGANWLKAWTPDEFNADCWCYIAEANSGAGGLYGPITDTTANAIVLANAAAPGDGTATFCVFKLVATDITAGITTGHKILTLRNSDANLKGFAIPETSSGAGAAAYGNDGYWFDKTAFHAAVRGGSFVDGAPAGVFSLSVSYAPGHSYYSIGFRAAKAL